MLDNIESRITFEVPSNLDFDKLIRDNNYTLFWQNLHSGESPYLGRSGEQDPAAAGTVLGDRNSSDFNLMSSLKHFAGERSGPFGWGLPAGGSGGNVDGAALMDGMDHGAPLLDASYLWIGAVMMLLVLSGLFCVCSCYLYYKYRRWQKCVSVATCQTLSNLDVEAPPPYDSGTLPSYTIASGLPSYDDAVRHLTGGHQQRSQQRTGGGGYEAATVVPRKPPTIHPPAVAKFFESRPQNWLNITIFEEIHYNFVRRGGGTSDAAGLGEQTPLETATPVDNSNVGQSAVDGGEQPAIDSGLFKIQICMLEDEKQPIVSHR